MALFDKKLVPIARNLSKKHRVGVYAADQTTLSGGYWDEGSRAEYWLLNLATGNKTRLACPTSPREYGGSEAPTFDIPMGSAVVRGGISRGKEACPFLYVRPADLPMIFGFKGEWDAQTPKEVIFDWLAERGIEMRSI